MTDVETITEMLTPPAQLRLSYDGPKAPLFKAFAEARKHFTSLSASATADVKISQAKGGGGYKFSYAPLDVVLEALQPGLTAAGLALLQPFDGDVMYTIVAFEGSSLTVETPLPTWSTPQELGSLLTYIRRYQLKGIFAVADSEDDDGNAASGNTAQVTRKEPIASPKSNGPANMPPEMASDITKAAKANSLSGAEFHALVKKQCRKEWLECDEQDGRKLLTVLGVVDVFGKDGAK